MRNIPNCFFYPISYVLIPIKSRQKSNKNGQKIFRMIEKDSSLFKDEDFYSILRTESDLIWIAYLRNMNVQEKYIKKNIINDLYNFEEIILIAHIKILLSLIFFQMIKLFWKKNRFQRLRRLGK